MKLLSKTPLLLLLFLAAILTYSNCAAKQTKCTIASRSLNKDCSTEEFTNICGYYTQNCPFNICGRSYANACYACQDTDVTYYVDETCDSKIVVDTCSDSYCDSILDPNKYTRFEPVCGFKKNCTGKDCSKTLKNLCTACDQTEYIYLQAGACEQDQKTCNANNRPKNCTASKSSPVCAFFTTNYDGEVYTTADNSCNACSDTSVSRYLLGTCPLRVDNHTYCLPHNRPKSCSKENKPVCGFYKSKDGEQILHKKISNACEACQDTTILYHTPGPCVFYCDRNPYKVVECDGSGVNVICGTYKKNGKSYNISLKNPCIGCFNVNFEIDSYTEGLCPGDEGIKCDNDADGFLNGFLSPVCGYSKTVCKSNTCRKTYTEPQLACSESSVILYAPGVCPGDNGISCAGYRAAVKAGNPDGVWLGNSYNNVCGYLKAGCKQKACRALFDDQYQACGNSSVLYFTGEQC